ncbi:phage-related terminase small subunit [Lacticaseibacillus sharpeae JCM 1186 = DSM 20505]|uniref:Putative HNH nuclease YajD n=1 Tax=Lacticaseibacillus sharpeae JCM 1186 = DSM 20505 TaxID=1291052 RepID=A0A0R1ZIT2_9LACO|nr:phage-related terminase small subunit [Lacticaseibacillus sharpeae JCM 1186 = DSM 20505]
MGGYFYVNWRATIVQTKLVFINGHRKLVPLDYRPRQDSDRAYNRHRTQTNGKYVAFYRSAQWLHLRQQILERDNGICQRCGMEATLVDHVVPSEDDWDDRLNADNLQSLCKDCHYYKTRRETAKRKKGVKRSMRINVIAGYPASGKTTYVAHHCGSHDLIFDYDAIMHALTGLPEHIKNIDVHDYVTLIRELILRKLKAEQTFDNVWIITTFPDEKLDSLLVSRDLHHLMLNTSKEVCIERLNKQHRNVPELVKVMSRIDEQKSEGKFSGFEIIAQ